MVMSGLILEQQASLGEESNSTTVLLYNFEVYFYFYF